MSRCSSYVTSEYLNNFILLMEPYVKYVLYYILLIPVHLFFMRFRAPVHSSVACHRGVSMSIPTLMINH